MQQQKMLKSCCVVYNERLGVKSMLSNTWIHWIEKWNTKGNFASLKKLMWKSICEKKKWGGEVSSE